MALRTITNPAEGSALSSSVIRNELQILENQSGNGASPTFATITGTLISLTNSTSTNTISVSNTSTGNLALFKQSGANGIIGVETFSATGQRSFLQLKRARGTIDSPTILVSGDEVGRLGFFGYDGSSYIQGASISGEVNESSIGTNSVGMDLVISTNPNNSNAITERMRITNAGAVLIGVSTLTNIATGQMALNGGVLALKEIASTPTADAGWGKLRTKSDNKLYFQDGDGVEHEIAFV